MEVPIYFYRFLASSAIALGFFSQPLFAQPFDGNMTKFPLVTKQDKGGQMQAFVVADSATDYMAVAKACSEYYMTKYKSAFCTVFASQADFDYSEIDRSDGSMGRFCDQAKYGVALGGNKFEFQSTSENLQSEKCPSTQPAKSPKVAKGTKGESAELKEAKEVLKEIEVVLKRGLEMGPLRNSSDRGLACGIAMRTNQSYAKAVKARADKLVVFNKVQLAANSMMELCVSCMDNGPEYCARLKKAIQEAKPVRESDGKSLWDK